MYVYLLPETREEKLAGFLEKTRKLCRNSGFGFWLSNYHLRIRKQIKCNKCYVSPDIIKNHTKHAQFDTNLYEGGGSSGSKSLYVTISYKP